MSREKTQSLSWWKGNILAVLVALVLAFIIFFAVQQSDSLFADIAWWKGSPTFSEQWDIGVFIQNKESLTVQSIKDIEGIENISMLLIFDPEEISLDRKMFTSDFPLTYASAWEGQGELILTIEGDLKTGEKLLTLWWKDVDITKIVVWDTILHFTDGGVESLSVEMKN